MKSTLLLVTLLLTATASAEPGIRTLIYKYWTYQDEKCPRDEDCDGTKSCEYDDWKGWHGSCDLGFIKELCLNEKESREICNQVTIKDGKIFTVYCKTPDKEYFCTK